MTPDLPDDPDRVETRQEFLGPGAMVMRGLAVQWG
jgi:hypothetical protein